VTPDQKEFLLAEFKSAWDTVTSIDNRRGVFASYYTALFVGAVSVVAGVLSRSEKIEIGARYALMLVLLMTFIAAVTVICILASERAANIRYRRKINLIRATFLSNAEDQAIKKYLSRKDLGIMLAEEGDQPKGIGRTLKYIFALLGIQAVTALGGAWWVWRL
jgi:hypothetical protein